MASIIKKFFNYRSLFLMVLDSCNIEDVISNKLSVR